MLVEAFTTCWQEEEISPNLYGIRGEAREPKAIYEEYVKISQSLDYWYLMPLASFMLWLYTT